MCHLCDECIWVDECIMTDTTFPVFHCVLFDDGYDGPDYPDGDVGTEWQMKTRHYQAHGIVE